MAKRLRGLLLRSIFTVALTTACNGPFPVAGDSADGPGRATSVAGPAGEQGAGGLGAGGGRFGHGVVVPDDWLTRMEEPHGSGAPTGNAAPGIDLRTGVTLPEPLLFPVGSALLGSEADDVLGSVANQAGRLLGPGQRLAVDGYVDEQGDPAYNEMLALARAEAVAARLIRLEPALAHRILIMGHGATELLNPDCRGDCPANRAVVIGIVG